MGKWQRALFQPNLPLNSNGTRVTACKEHINLSKTAAKEGMVLLKNEETTLPFSKGTKLALFGKGCLDYVKGGGGSGDVTVSYIQTLVDGMRTLEDTVSLYEASISFYEKELEAQYAAGKLPGMTKEPLLPASLCEGARAFTDTAVITICRFSGEDCDRKSSYDLQEASEDELFEGGDFYLSHAEKAMVEQVKKYFDKIVVVLNVGGMVDTEWFFQDAKIKSVLLALQGGMEGGTAAAELLFGIGNPCGKLCDTFAKQLEDYPSSFNFHESDDYVNYSEDIYVGYRYFETIPEASQRVNYPFGFGLSYTSFAWSVNSVSESNDTIQVDVSVTNTGKRAGREVLQLYTSAPQGLLGKPAKTLTAFEKTRCLLPGETQHIFLSFTISSLASYDDLGKVQANAYVLEKGDYTFFIGNSVRNVQPLTYRYTLEDTRIVQQLSAKLVPSSLPERMLSNGTMEPLPLTEKNDPNATEITYMEGKDYDCLFPATRPLPGRFGWKTPYKEGCRPLIDVANGQLSLDAFLAQLSDEEIAHLLGGQPNTGAANTFGIGNMPEYGIPNIMTADGPAGLRIEPKCGIHTTAFPCATLLACTWDRELVYQIGVAGAKEVKENNIGMWLTPAVNIHRSPLCGRNFEYYSEDPLLAGVLAAEMVKGIQSQHISASVKHFALNNKETNRKNSDSRISERAAREIYLKPFEIIVKTAKPWCIMSSYNIINGHRASENKELLTDILRGEWGFDGLVTTDWWTYGQQYKEIKAQNDLKMGCGYPDHILEALSANVLTREEMDICAKRILEFILKID